MHKALITVASALIQIAIIIWIYKLGIKDGFIQGSQYTINQINQYKSDNPTTLQPDTFWFVNGTNVYILKKPVL